MLPRRMVVFARIGGSGSICSLDRYLSRFPCVRCVSLGASTSVALSVSSRTNGSSSVNELDIAGKIVSSASLFGRCSANRERFSMSATRTNLSDELVSFDPLVSLAKSLTIVGVTLAAKSSSERPSAACSIGDTASAGALPNTSASPICGRIFRCTGAFARDSMTLGRCRKNCSFSMESLSVRLSRNVIVSTSLLEKRLEFSTSFFGLYLRSGAVASSLW
mmetsp:Transcript_10040/g.39217  ORF Transcript_10040/g.39217 Transcript_10040/m.39217 type:complete len:220 (-) Transcript_10040:817-1476(-)